MSILDKRYRITFENGDIWEIPVEVIARNRAEYYANACKGFNGDVNKSLLEDTIPLFESDDYEIQDWAQNNMNWEDVEEVAFFVGRDDDVFIYQDMWINPKKVGIV